VPLGGCLLVPVLGAINERLMKWYSVLVGFATAALTLALIHAANGQEIGVLYWIPGIDATFGLQLTGVGTISEEDYAYILNHSQSVYCFVSCEFVLEKINKIKEQVPTLKEVYCFDEISETRIYILFVKVMRKVF